MCVCIHYTIPDDNSADSCLNSNSSTLPKMHWNVGQRPEIPYPERIWSLSTNNTTILLQADIIRSINTQLSSLCVLYTLRLTQVANKHGVFCVHHDSMSHSYSILHVPQTTH